MDERDLNNLEAETTGATESAEALPLQAVSPPLKMGPGGVVRVGHSRISLDLVVEQYENGMTPEDMVRAYDTLALADVHAVIAYYLGHRDEVRAYLKRRIVEAASLREKIEAERPATCGGNCWHAAALRRSKMLRLASDADVHGDIIRGLRRLRAGGNIRLREPITGYQVNRIPARATV